VNSGVGEQHGPAGKPVALVVCHRLTRDLRGSC
jgi:hypothetical protein